MKASVVILASALFATGLCGFNIKKVPQKSPLVPKNKLHHKRSVHNNHILRRDDGDDQGGAVGFPPPSWPLLPGTV
jgi:hypothetical protein